MTTENSFLPSQNLFLGMSKQHPSEKLPGLSKASPAQTISKGTNMTSQQMILSHNSPVAPKTHQIQKSKNLKATPNFVHNLPSQKQVLESERPFSGSLTKNLAMVAGNGNIMKI
jgi:hypothetical protein